MPYPSPSKLSGNLHRHYWSDRAHERTEFLIELVDRLHSSRIPTTVHEGWTNADLDIYPHGWTALTLCTVQEDHSGGHRLLRVRIGMEPNHQMWWATTGLVILVYLALMTPAWIASVGAAILGGLVVMAWRESIHRRRLLIAHADQAAEAIGLLAMQPTTAAPEDLSVEEAFEGVIEGLRPRRLEPATS